MAKLKQAKKKTSGTGTTRTYEDFVRALQLIGLGLDSCSATLDRDIYFANLKDGLERKIETKFELEAIGDGFFEPVARFKLTAQDKAGKPAIRIECAFSAHFHLEGEISNAFAKRFTESEFRVVMWPYFRQFVADLTARMAIPPVLVPFASPVELRK